MLIEIKYWFRIRIGGWIEHPDLKSGRPSGKFLIEIKYWFRIRIGGWIEHPDLKSGRPSGKLLIEIKYWFRIRLRRMDRASRPKVGKAI
ncbi:MAG: hypothetical protein J0L87_10715 [Bacteroidetes bacterium]|nr:hypothetical protein [Bacteroidota bacterium]